MATTVDQRVVQMQFDNKQFEAGVQETLNSLNKLNDTIERNTKASGNTMMSGISKHMSLANAQMAKMNYSLDTMRDKFSAIGTISDQVLRNITNSVQSFFHKGLSLITSGPKQGFNEYELFMSSIQTIMAGTGESVERVTEKLQELNDYSDKTIYKFKDMTSNIGKFTNQGVDLDTAVAAMKGIANEAALAGASTEQASHAMYNYAQALGSGSVKLIDWKSIENAMMSTREYRDVLLQVAQAVGTVKKNADGTYDTLTQDAQGNPYMGFNADSKFRESLKTNWLNSDVLMQASKIYAQDIRDLTDAERDRYEQELKQAGFNDKQITYFEDLGKRANDAAKDVKSFSMLVDTLGEAIGTGWTDSFGIIIGDLNEAKGLWTGLSNILGNVIKKIQDYRNEALQYWKDNGGRYKMLQTLANILNAIWSVITPIKEAFAEVTGLDTSNLGKGLLGATDFLEQFTRNLILSRERMEDIKKVAVTLFSTIGKGLQFILKFRKPILNFLLIVTMLKAIRSLFMGGLGLNTIVSIFKIILAFNLLKTINGWTKGATSFSQALEMIAAKLSELFSKIKNSKVTAALVTAAKVAGKVIVGIIGTVSIAVAALINKIRSIDWAAIGSNIAAIGTAIASAFKAAYSAISGVKWDAFTNPIDKLKAFGSGAGASIKGFFTKDKGQNQGSDTDDQVQSVNDLNGAVQTLTKTQEKAKEVTQSYSVENKVLMAGATAMGQEIYTMSKNTGEAAEKTTALAEASERAQPALQTTQTILERIVGAIQGFIGYLNTSLIESGKAETFVGNVAAKLASLDWQKILAVGYIVLYLHYVKKLSSSISGMATKFETVGGQLKKTLGSIAGFFNQWNKPEKKFRDIAIGVALLTASLIALSAVPLEPEKIDAAAKAIALMGVSVAGTVVGMEAILTLLSRKVNVAGMAAITTSILSITASLILLSAQFIILAGVVAVVLKLSKSLGDKMAILLIPLGIIAAGIIGLTLLLTKLCKNSIKVDMLAGNLLKLAGGIAAFAGSLILLTAAIKIVYLQILSFIGMVMLINTAITKLYNIAVNQFGKDNVIKVIVGACIVVAAAIVGIVILMKILVKQITGITLDVAKSMALLGLSMMTLSAGMSMLAASSIGFLSALSGAAGILIVLAGALAIFSLPIFQKGIENLKSVGKGLALMGAGILMMAGGIALMGQIPWDKLVRGMVGVGFAIAAMAYAINMLNTVEVGKIAGAVLSLAGAMYLLMPVVLLTGLMWKPMAIGIGLVAGMMIAMAGAIKLMSNAKPGSIIPIVAVMTLAIFAMGTMADNLAKMPDADKGITNLMILTYGLAGAVAVIAHFTKDLKAVQSLGLAAIFASFAGSIALMVGCIKMLNGIKDTNQLGVSVTALAITMGAFALCIAKIASITRSFKPADVAGFAAIIGSFAGAIALLGVITRLLSTADLPNLIASAVALNVTMGIFALCVAKLMTLAKGMQSLQAGNLTKIFLSFAGAISALGLVMALMANMPVDGLVASAVALNISMIVFAGAVVVMMQIAKGLRSIQADNIMKICLSFAASIAILSGSMLLLSLIPSDKILGICAILGIFSAALVVLTAVVGHFGPALATASPAIAAFAAVLGGVASVLFGFAAAVVSFGVAAVLVGVGVGIITAAVSLLTAVIGAFLPKVTEFLGSMNALSKYSGNLEKMADVVGKFGQALIVLGIGGVAAGVGGLAAAAGIIAIGTAVAIAMLELVALVAIFESLRANASEWGLDLTSQFADGMLSGIQMIINAAGAIAHAIWSLLHFSDPEDGELSGGVMFQSGYDAILQWGQGAVAGGGPLKDMIGSVLGDVKTQLGDFKNSLGGGGGLLSSIFGGGGASGNGDGMTSAGTYSQEAIAALNNFKNAYAEYVDYVNANPGILERAQQGDYDDGLIKLQDHLSDAQKSVEDLGFNVMETGDAVNEAGDIYDQTGHKIQFSVHDTAEGVKYTVKNASQEVSKEAKKAGEESADNFKEGADAEGTGNDTVWDLIKGVFSGQISAQEAWERFGSMMSDANYSGFNPLASAAALIQGLQDGSVDPMNALIAWFGQMGSAAGQAFASSVHTWMEAAEGALKADQAALQKADQYSNAGYRYKEGNQLKSHSGSALYNIDLPFSAENFMQKIKDAVGGTAPKNLPTGGGGDGGKKSKGGSGGSTKEVKDATKALAEYSDVAAKLNSRVIPIINRFAKTFGSIMTQLSDRSPYQIASGSFELLVDKIYKTSDAFDETYEDSDEKGTALQQRANAIRETLVKAFDEITDAVKGSLDFFTEFDTSVSTLLKPQQLLDNAKSQVRALSMVEDALEHLAYRGVDDDTLADLGSNPLENYEKIMQLRQMSNKELKEFISIQSQGDALSKDAAARVWQARMVALQLQKYREQGIKSYDELDEASKAYFDYISAQKNNTDATAAIQKLQEIADNTGISLEELRTKLESTVNISDIASASTLKNISEIYEKLDESQTVIDKYKDKALSFASAMSDAMSSFGDGFADYTFNTQQNGQALIRNLKNNIMGLQSMQVNILKLQNSGIDQGLLQQLMSGGADMVAAATKLDSKGITEINSLYKQYKDLSETTYDEQKMYQDLSMLASKKYSTELLDALKRNKQAQKDLNTETENYEKSLGSAEEQANSAMSAIESGVQGIAGKYNKVVTDAKKKTEETTKDAQNKAKQTSSVVTNKIDETYEDYADKSTELKEKVSDDSDAMFAEADDKFSGFNTEFLVGMVSISDAIKQAEGDAQGSLQVFNQMIELMQKFGVEGQDIQTILGDIDGVQETLGARMISNFQELYEKILDDKGAMLQLQEQAGEVGQAISDHLSSIDPWAEITKKDDDEKLLGSDLLKRLFGNLDQAKTDLANYKALIQKAVDNDISPAIVESLAGKGSEYLQAAMTWSTEDLRQAANAYDQITTLPTTAQEQVSKQYLDTAKIAGKTFDDYMVSWGTDVSKMQALVQMMNTTMAGVISPEITNLATQICEQFGIDLQNALNGGTADENGKTSTTAANAMTNVGTAATDSITSTLEQKTPQITAATGAVAKAATDEVKKEVNAKSASDTAAEYTDSMVATINSKQQAMYDAGVNLMQGLINGIQSKVEELQALSNTVANIPPTAIQVQNDEHSPSKRMFKLGAFLDEGLLNGINSGVYDLVSASNNVANIVGSSIASLGTDVRPNISPVIDYSNANSGSRSLAALFDQTKNPINLTADIGKVTSPQAAMNAKLAAMIGRLGNGDVVAAIAGLSGDIDALGKAVQNMQIVMDTGVVAGAVTGGVSTNINNEVGRKQAVWL